MSLEEIRARAEKWMGYSGESKFRSIAGTVAAKRLIGEDIPKLVAALEAIDKLCAEIDTRSGYDVNASVNVEYIRDIITEALS